MSELNLIFLVALVLVVIILLIIVLAIILKNDKSEASSKKRTVSNYEISLPNIDDISLPTKIESLEVRDLENITYKIFELYKYFDFKNMSIQDLEKKDWHSWQISMLLMLYKRKESFHIVDKKKYFGKFLLENDENSIKSLMNDILKKYENYVNIINGKDELSKDYIWTNRDVSIIFYFLSNYKSY